MVDISSNQSISRREVFYQRQRTKNRFFSKIAAFFAKQAELENITKRELAKKLSCDPAQITRWLTNPSNMSIEGISDILLSMGAEAELNVIDFASVPTPNYEHPLITAASRALNNETKPVASATGVTNALSVQVSNSNTTFSTTTGVYYYHYVTGDLSWQKQPNSKPQEQLLHSHDSETGNIEKYTQTLTSLG